MPERNDKLKLDVDNIGCLKNRDLSCPFSSKEFVIWVNNISDELKRVNEKIQEDSNNRHSSNEAIAQVIDTERLNIINLEEQISSLAEMHRELLEIIRGTWANPGIVNKINTLKEEVKDINEHTKEFEESVKLKASNQKAFIAGIMFIGSVTGSIIGFVSTFLLYWLK